MLKNGTIEPMRETVQFMRKRMGIHDEPSRKREAVAAEGEKTGETDHGMPRRADRDKKKRTKEKKSEKRLKNEEPSRKGVKPNREESKKKEKILLRFRTTQRPI